MTGAIDFYFEWIYPTDQRLPAKILKCFHIDFDQNPFWEYNLRDQFFRLIKFYQTENFLFFLEKKSRIVYILVAETPSVNRGEHCTRLFACSSRALSAWYFSFGSLCWITGQPCLAHGSQPKLVSLQSHVATTDNYPRIKTSFLYYFLSYLFIFSPIHANFALKLLHLVYFSRSNVTRHFSWLLNAT